MSIRQSSIHVVILLATATVSLSSCGRDVSDQLDVERVTGASVSTPWLITAGFRDADGFTNPIYYKSVKFPDVSGDFIADVCGRGSAGIYCGTSSADGTLKLATAPTLWNGYFKNGPFSWDTRPSYYATIQYPNLNTKEDLFRSRSDVCGRYADGVHCALSNGVDGFLDNLGSRTNADLWDGGFFSNANGWSDSEMRWSSIQYPDINNDGDADICGRRDDGIYCGLSNGHSFSAPTRWNSYFTDANFGGGPEYWSTIQYADINGDGAKDVCGRRFDGLHCALSNAVDGFLGPTKSTAQVWSGYFSDANGWNLPERYSTIGYPLLDFTFGSGGSAHGVCGRDMDGIHCAYPFPSTGVFRNAAGQVNKTELMIGNGEFSDAQGWRATSWYKTIQYLPDSADSVGVCGRWSGGIKCAWGPRTVGAKFVGPVISSTSEIDAAGWTDESHYSSITITPDMRLCERAVAGVQCSQTGNYSQLTVNPWLYGAGPGAFSYNGPNPTVDQGPTWAPHISWPQDAAGAEAHPYWDGPTITIQPVLWTQTATGCTPTPPSLTAAQITNFYKVILGSTQLNWVQAEYGIPPLAVNGVVNTPANVINPACGQNISRAQMEAGLIDMIETKKTFGASAKSAAPMTIYALHMPANMQPLPLGFGYNGTGYFSDGTAFHYLVLPDFGTDTATATALESHELYENLTDPIQAQFRSRNQSGSDGNTESGTTWSPVQGADFCQNSQVRGTIGCTLGTNCAGTTPVWVEPFWSNISNTCAIATQGAANDVGFELLGHLTGTNNIGTGYSGGSGITLVPTTGTRISILGSRKNRTSSGLSFFSAGLDTQNGDFLAAARKTGVKLAAGDFNGDGLGDIALAMPSPGSCVIPVATRGFGAQPSGTNYHVTFGKEIKQPAPANFVGVVDSDAFPCFTNSVVAGGPLPPVVGDFNGDGLSDMAMLGGGWAGGTTTWTTIPIAFSAGATTNSAARFSGDAFDGQIDFWQTNNPDTGGGPGTPAPVGVVGLNKLIADVLKATGKPPHVVAGDFDGDGLSDIAIVGVRSGSVPATTIAVAHSKGDGTFIRGDYSVVYRSTDSAGNNGSDQLTQDLNSFATSTTQVVAGDFNADGMSDIAVVTTPGGAPSNTIMVAFAHGGYLGTRGRPGKLLNFVLTYRATLQNEDFANAAAKAGAQVVSGDYDGDGAADLAVAGMSGTEVVVAFSNAVRSSRCIGSKCTDGVLGLFTSVHMPNSAFQTGAQAGARVLSVSQGLVY